MRYVHITAGSLLSIEYWGCCTTGKETTPEHNDSIHMIFEGNTLHIVYHILSCYGFVGKEAILILRINTKTLGTR